jgi:predicted AAA+ superfamily ATPase
MMQEQILIEWNPWWTGDIKSDYLEREVLEKIIMWINKKQVIPITGCRRSGKTTIMYILIKHLLTNVPGENILFIKCDDERILEENLIEGARIKHLEMFNPTGKVYIFLDEVQELKDWDRTVKRIYDLEKDVKIFLTGSRLLKSELSTSLAGRFVYFDVYPLSFREFIKSKNETIHGKLEIFSKRHKIKNHLREYIQWGGFPEIVLEKNDDFKKELLKFYSDSILYRDVIKRSNVTKIDKVENLKNYLFPNISNLLNYNKIAKHLGISSDTVSSYLHAMEEAYFFFPLSIFSYSFKKQLVNPKKIYCTDTGIRNAVGFKFSSDLGRLYENIVFMELKRYNNETYYWKDSSGEVDFLIKKGDKIIEAIQVCCDISTADERETRSLLSALDKFDLDKGTIISGDIRDVKNIGEKTIEYIPLWEWLLSSSISR